MVQSQDHRHYCPDRKVTAQNDSTKDNDAKRVCSINDLNDSNEPVQKSSATHFWVTSHHLRNAALEKMPMKRAVQLQTVHPERSLSLRSTQGTALEPCDPLQDELNLV